MSMHKPPGTLKLTEKSFTEFSTLVSGSTGTIFSSSDISQWSNIAITLVPGTDNLGTIAVEFSPDNSNWETFDASTFSSLTASAISSSQISGNSRSYLRVRSTDTPRATIVTASLHLNNG